MQITIEVPDSLATVAAGKGQTAEAYAAEVLNRFVAEYPPFKPTLSPEEFIREISKFSGKMTRSQPSASTREEIYADHD